jgi:subtilisin family serine protease
MRLRRYVLLGFVLPFLLADGVGAQGLGQRPTGLLPSLPPQVAAGRPDHVALPAPALRAPLDRLRRLQVRDLLRTQRDRIDIDARGEPVLRGEFLMLGSDAASLDAVRAAGFEVAPRASGEDTLGLDVTVLRDRRGRRATRAMRDLQRAAPGATFAYQHVYLQAGATPTAAAAAAAAVPPATRSLRLGLVDGGVDASHPSLAGVRIHRHGCNGAAVPQAHGTAVATRLVGGAAGQLYAADLWCGDAVPRATLGLVEALAWLSRERVPVINISLVGPDNPVLARAVQAMLARGHVLVAAVGNDGPAAPPLYPAAYAGVIGVSGVDARQRVLPESGSGPHVDFSAPGVVGEGARAMRGTSFAAPVIARLAAETVREPDESAATRVQQMLAARARDLGKPGRDPRYGEGLVDPFS